MRKLEVNRVQSPHSFVEETEVQIGAELCPFLIELLCASALMTLHLHMDHAKLNPRLAQHRLQYPVALPV